ncbi:MAG: DUF3078 domain-containing protein [Phocaeicola sp.]|uniref:DUF3078 domain-containing protein n=1 Tax=Phocaeicola TaxID=909656 RepID=UPI00234E6579|nr:DUF3078 domain-containing protein [Phocaeicola oris]MCE2615562.1 DUF3078 domain-containing protein [Phocaeicola oris]
MKKHLFIFAFLLILCSSLSAQDIIIPSNIKAIPVTQTINVPKAFSDSLNNLAASYRAWARLWEDPTVVMPKLKPDPDFYKLFVPPTYYNSVAEQAYVINWKKPESIYPENTAADSLYSCVHKSAELYQLPDMERKKAVDKWVNKILLTYYLEQPNNVLGNEAYLADAKPLGATHVVTAPREEAVTDYVEPAKEVTNVTSDEGLVVLRPNFWTKKGNGYTQLSQHYISDNWYKGGESTVSLLSGIVLEANYNDRQKVQWDNKFEAKLGFITAPSDTVHSYKTNQDLLRITSKLGVQAWKHWYYTLAAEVKSQFFASYSTNTDNMISNFLSPLELDITLGMDYKRQEKNYTLSVLTSPLAYTFIYINNDHINDVTKFNVETGHITAHMFGSKITGNLTWNISKNITWTSVLEYFTTYKKIIANWENTFDFKVNKYLSTKLFINPRYDDGVTKNHSYFQLTELLSFGLNYTW